MSSRLERQLLLLNRHIKPKMKSWRRNATGLSQPHKPESKYVPHIKNCLKAYVTDEKFRSIINERHYGDLNAYPGFTMKEFKALNGRKRVIPDRVKDCVPVDQYME